MFEGEKSELLFVVALLLIFDYVSLYIRTCKHIFLCTDFHWYVMCVCTDLHGDYVMCALTSMEIICVCTDLHGCYVCALTSMDIMYMH